MAIILALATLLGLTFNAVRPDPLPLRPTSAPTAPQADISITVEHARELHATGHAFFIDARDALTYAQGHIQGALSLPAEDFAFVFPALHAQITDRLLIVYCDGEQCPLSQDVSERLRAYGLNDIRELRNGWTLWREAGFPVSTGALP